MYMDEFKILLNCNICEVFDSDYKLMKHTSKFHLTSFFPNSDVHNNNNNHHHHYNCGCSHYNTE
jgi:ABC-type nickel/cobalt efflux system permease component RcnA